MGCRGFEDLSRPNSQHSVLTELRIWNGVKELNQSSFSKHMSAGYEGCRVQDAQGLQGAGCEGCKGCKM